MYAIGIDIGTTSICGVLIDASEGNLLRKRTVNSDAFIKTANPWEKLQDVSKIIAIAKEILEELLVKEVQVIGLTGQMHSILYTDSRGKAVSPLYTWQDERGNLPYQETTYAKYLGSNTGYGNVTDFYNRINGIRPKAAVSYCTIQDYLAMELCGLKKPVIHISDAASFGCFDLQKEKFVQKPDTENSDKIEPEAELRNDYAIVGQYKGILVSIAIGDNQASVFSTLADEKELLVNVGTGSQITIVSPKVISGENIESRPYVEGKYLVVGAALCGGRAYSMLKDFYKEVIEAAGGDTTDVYSVMEQMIRKEAQNTLQVDTRFAGTRANPKLRGSITGIGVDNFMPGALALGVLEGMTEELFTMYQQMQTKRWGLVGSGNGIRQNQQLIHMIEARFEKDLKIPAHKEEAAYGAALFGLVACGRFKNGVEAQKLIKYQGEKSLSSHKEARILLRKTRRIEMKRPIFFERNRVGRVYTGGKLFAGFFGDEPVDNFLPEEWIASAVKAVNRVMHSEKDGVSKLEGTEIYFDDVLAENPIELLGSSGKMRILVKVLDSAVRLPAQAHPDKAYSRKHFQSEYGKTESWIILDTRENAKLFFGFQDGVTRESFAKAIDDSRAQKDAMEKLMRYRVPEKKDVFLVPAKTVHAIGAGCLILEIQEPTDFTIQPEHWCGDYELNDMEMYQGVSKEDAIDCFDFTKAPDTKMSAKLLAKTEGALYENLIGESETECFVINRISLEGGEHRIKLNDTYGVYIVTEGGGQLIGADYQREIEKGDYFFMPCCAMGEYKLCGELECVECY